MLRCSNRVTVALLLLLCCMYCATFAVMRLFSHIGYVVCSPLVFLGCFGCVAFVVLHVLYLHSLCCGCCVSFAALRLLCFSSCVAFAVLACSGTSFVFHFVLVYLMCWSERTDDGVVLPKTMKQFDFNFLVISIDRRALK